MHVSFGSHLRRMGGIRVGFRMRGWTAFIALIVNLCIWVTWYSLLGTAWLVYGCFWLTWQVIRVVLILPIKGIFKGLAKLFHRKRPEA